MKRYMVLTIIFLSFSTHADQRAVTDEGDIVILSSDGTWKYEDAGAIKPSEIGTNEIALEKSVDSKFRLKSTKNKSEFWIDPKEWSFQKEPADQGNEAEYTFKLKGKDVYGMAITEKIEIDLPNLGQIALENAKSGGANDMKIVTQEYRIVNGNKVMYMEMEGIISGISVIYLGYYYSDNSGTTQYLTYTGSNLVGQYKTEIDKFLNGFSVQQ